MTAGVFEVGGGQRDTVVDPGAQPPDDRRSLDPLARCGGEFYAESAGGDQQRVEDVIGVAVEHQSERRVDQMELQRLPGELGVTRNIRSTCVKCSGASGCDR